MPPPQQALFRAAIARYTLHAGAAAPDGIMLTLDDPRWRTLTAYGNPADLPGLLRTLQQSTTPEQAAALTYAVSEYICHQYDVYSASYAVVPHLAALAAGRAPAEQVPVLALIGLIAALAQRQDAEPVPADLRPAYEAALQQAGDLVLDNFRRPCSHADFGALVGALAAIRGHAVLAIDLLDTLRNPREVQCPVCEAFYRSFGYELIHGTDAA
jgi:hypothetical protein